MALCYHLVTEVNQCWFWYGLLPDCAQLFPAPVPRYPRCLTSIGYQPDTLILDWHLIHVNPRVFAIWVLILSKILYHYHDRNFTGNVQHINHCNVFGNDIKLIRSKIHIIHKVYLFWFDNNWFKPWSSGLLHWYCNNHTLVMGLMKGPWTHSKQKCHLNGTRIPIIKIKCSHNYLILIMTIVISIKLVFTLNQSPKKCG